MNKQTPDIIVETYHGPEENWNRLLKGFSGASIFQTSYWAHYCQDQFKQCPLYCILYSRGSDIPLGLCLVLIETKQAVASWIAGPLLNREMYPQLSPVGVIQKLVDFLKRKNVIRVEKASLPYDFFAMPDSEPQAIIQLDWDLTDWATYVICLRNTPEEVWRRFDPSVRKNVKKCERANIHVVRLESLEAVENQYLPILLENRKRLGFDLPPTYPNANLWKWLRYQEANTIMETFVAQRYGETLAGLGVIGFQGTITEVGVAQSRNCFDEKIPAHDLIKWEIIKWGIASGLREYDLAGVSPRPKDDKETGIRRFKKKFAGEYRTYWMVSKILNQPRYSIAQLKARILSRMNRLIKVH